jgi:hypothetical protein
MRIWKEVRGDEEIFREDVSLRSRSSGTGNGGWVDEGDSVVEEESWSDVSV